MALAAALFLTGWLGMAQSASARLGDTFPRFRYSALIQGDTLFKFDGRKGSRFQFGMARNCTLGAALLLLDTVDGIIVQQTIVLPLPHTTKDMKRYDAIAILFLEDAGLDKKTIEEAMAAYRESYSTAKPVEKLIGPEKSINLNTFAKPEFGHILLAVGIKPEGQRADATPEP